LGWHWQSGSEAGRQVGGLRLSSKISLQLFQKTREAIRRSVTIYQNESKSSIAQLNEMKTRKREWSKKHKPWSGSARGS
jgi:hypothetical protein